MTFLVWRHMLLVSWTLPLSQTVTPSRTPSPSSVTYFMDGPIAFIMAGLRDSSSLHLWADVQHHYRLIHFKAISCHIKTRLTSKTVMSYFCLKSVKSCGKHTGGGVLDIDAFFFLFFIRFPALSTWGSRIWRWTTRPRFLFQRDCGKMTFLKYPMAGQT